LSNVSAADRWFVVSDCGLPPRTDALWNGLSHPSNQLIRL
jgi:hypothetical protein